ncbi:MAG: MBL fold metallo-hydrolase [Planctomycetota bacterium]
MLTVTWYGHAAFKLESPEMSLILDPYKYPDAGGYLPINDSADAVLISHINDRYHSHTGQISPGFELLEAHKFPSDGVWFRNVLFQSIPVFETPEKLPDDEVTVFYFTMGGLKVVFLGDLGHPLTPRERAPLQSADLLIASTGGKPTIALDELLTLIDQINPLWIIPMHFKTDKINLNILRNEEFMKLVADRFEATYKADCSTRLDPSEKPHSTTVIVLDHCR